jgi:hypothetical protein
MLCPDGDHEVKVRWNASAGERFCPTHGCALRSLPKKRSTGRRSESAAETRARQAFNQTVCAYPCFFQRYREGHVCDYPLDAHHLVPKQFLRQRLGDRPEEELLEVLYNPLIGAPLCRAAHNSVESRADHIFWDELSADCVRFVTALPAFVLIRLETESPRR